MTPAPPISSASPGTAGANAVLGDIALPAMLLKNTALDNNLAVMKQYAGDHGFVLAPHGKTTMAPKIFQRQLEAGAWAITVANMTQAAVAYQAGAQRVLVANEVVSSADSRAVVEARAGPGRVNSTALSIPWPGYNSSTGTSLWPG